MAAIRATDLTPTFQDAIEITRRLGVQYIWIDAICIVQDSPDEWAAESVKMCDIYENSLLTIAASHAKDGFGGCFNKKGNATDSEKSFHITTENSEGQESSIILQSRGSMDPPNTLELSPLNTRGWVYQERVPSPRTAHFTSTQVIWECRTGYFREDLRPISLPSASSSIRRETALENATAGIATIWYENILRKYSELRFTEYKDRLVALAGIAQIYHHHSKDEYIGGLWASQLAFGLAWKLDTTGPLPQRTRRDPSWTWASHDCKVLWYSDPGSFAPDAEFALISSSHLDFITTPRKKFGPLQGGYLRVAGLIAQVIQVGTQKVDPWGAVNLQIKGSNGLFTGDDLLTIQDINRVPSNAVALVLGHHETFKAVSTVLILVPHKLGGSRYVRVGHGLLEFEEQNERRAFCNSCSRLVLDLY